MIAAPHPDQAARLNALRSYDILDTPREAAFDTVVDLAARLCGAPIAVINLIDEERQWFKAEIGLGVCETPLDTSICAHAILVDGFVEIPDTLVDPRTADNPICVEEGGFRYYAGVALQTVKGLPIGSLCVLDHVPRTLDSLQREALNVLAAQVMAQLELRAALARETLLRKEIDHRVKNSLHTVAAFAQLQRQGLSPDAAAPLRAVEQQVGAVALLHDLLSHSDDHARVDLAEYLKRLTDVIAGTLPAGIRVTGNFDPLGTSPASAAALGAVLNELVTNALKHSFGGGAAGSIVLTGRHDGMTYRIVCEDDGDSAPAAARSASGLGMRIMAAAVRQVAGSFISGAGPSGYRSIVEFPAG